MFDAFTPLGWMVVVLIVVAVFVAAKYICTGELFPMDK